MNVSLTSNLNLWQVANTAQVALTSASTSALSTAAGSDSPVSDSSLLSGPAKVISELQTLSKTNPAEFKKITSELATQFQKAAEKATQPGQRDFLNELATTFQKASETGSLSNLIPQFNHSPSGVTGTPLPPNPVGTGNESPGGTGGGNGDSYPTGGTGGTNGTGLHYGPSPNASDDTLASIFSQALAQVQSRL